MKLICAGLPKTGTKSLASALRILGYSVHDWEEQHSYHLDEYLDALQGKHMPDFAKMYANVDAITDSPACLFWDEIWAAFPEAKVLLMTRDSAEVWSKSLEKTRSAYRSVQSSLWMRLKFVCTPTGRKFKKVLYGNNSVANPHVNTYTEHNARVKSSIPRDQLLVYNVKQGWKPLCEFLGVEVPDVPFPRLNVDSKGIGELFCKSRLQEKVTKELFWILALIAVLCALLFN